MKPSRPRIGAAPRALVAGSPSTSPRLGDGSTRGGGLSGGWGGTHQHIGRDRPGNCREVASQPPPWARRDAQSENCPPDATGLLTTGFGTGFGTGDAVTWGSFDSLPTVETWTGLSAAASSGGCLRVRLGVKTHDRAARLRWGGSAQVDRLFPESRAPPPYGHGHFRRLRTRCSAPEGWRQAWDPGWWRPPPGADKPNL